METRPDAVSDRPRVTAPIGRHRQPVNNVQWLHRSKLRANTWNPNKVAPPELYLLKLSLLCDGWTQPIVARPDGEIADGFHRWLVSNDAEVYKLTDGFVPVVYLPHEDRASLMMSTIRHNRARGTHYVLQIAEDVQILIDEEGLSKEEVGRLLQMESEEVERLYDKGQMTKRGARQEFGKGWAPQ